MKKIMFNDKYGLTQAVLEGRKTMTRREIPLTDTDREYLDTAFDFDFRESVIIDRYSRYKVGEVVAVAQSYEQVYLSLPEDERHKYSLRIAAYYRTGDLHSIPGWTNKMFVRADFMLDHIRIKAIKAERLQDISDEDCKKEGIMEGEFMNTWDTFYFDEWGDAPNHITFPTVRKAFAALIDRISGKGAWEQNPWVFAYEFEKI